MAEGVWDLKCTLQELGCGFDLVIRVGMLEDVIEHVLDWYENQKNCQDGSAEVAGIWMTEEEGTEEKQDERRIREVVDAHGIEFKLWGDEKYYIDEYAKPSPFS